MVTAATFPFTTGATVYMVVAQEITGLHTDASGVFCEFSEGSGLNRDISTTTLNADLSGGAQVQTTLVDGTFYTIGIVCSATQIDLYVNGIHIGSDTTGASIVQTAFYIFQNHFNANTGNKRFAEIVVLNQAISAPNRALLENYFKTKFNHY